MTEPFIIDAHVHLGPAGQLASADASVRGLLASMDRLAIEYSVASDHTALLSGQGTGLARLHEAYDESRGRVRGLLVFNPRDAARCLAEMTEAVGWAGFAGIKIHPAFHGTAAEDAGYAPAWEFAAAHDLAILTHTWSVSDHNPSQALSTPGRFERWLEAFPSVRLVMGHAGGRGPGRHEAIRLAKTYPGAYLDFAGDIYCRNLIEQLVASLPTDKILFGSDWPWMGPGDHLTRVLMASIGEGEKWGILRQNAAAVYRIKD